MPHNVAFDTVLDDDGASAEMALILSKRQRLMGLWWAEFSMILSLVLGFCGELRI